MIRTPLSDEFWEFIRITEEEDDVSWNCKAHESVLIASNLHNGLITRGNVSLSKNAGSPVFLVDNTMLHLVRRDDVPNHYGMGRVIRDPAWIDMNLIKGFLDNCERRHGDRCELFPFREDIAHLAQPAFLIDLSASCIITSSKVPNAKRFVSLSYVRRSEDAEKYLSLTKANLETLQQPGALDEAASQGSIPATFRDAMLLVAHLGIPYIWIDQLCVPQDDGPAKARENPNTAYIAAGAVFVIAECDGHDASRGLRGVPLPGSQPRYFTQLSYPFGPDETFIRSTGSQRDLLISRRNEEHMYTRQAHSRAETATARRVLRFEMGTVQWTCRSCPSWAAGDKDVIMGRMQVDDHLWESCAHECSAERFGCPVDKQSKDEKAWTRALAQPWPPVKEYYDMLAELTQLQTGKDEPGDMFDAAAGLVAAFAGHFQGRMISGLPESCFDLAMLWRIPAKSRQNPKRPSWSWAGWKSDPDDQYPWGLLPAPEVDGADHTVAKEDTSVEIIPLVNWFVGDLSSTERQPLSSTRWHDNRETFRDPRAALSPGWMRVEEEDLDELTKIGAPRGYGTNSTVRFTFTSLQEGGPRHPSPAFWYPVPIRHEQQAGEEINKSYLFATLEISREGFYVHREDWPSHSGAEDPFVAHVTRQGERSISGTQVLRNARGEISGVLDVHDPDHESIFHSDSGPERASVELVAVSRGQTRQLNGPYPECDARPEWQEFRNKSWYEFYNVLWVKWRDVEEEGVKIRGAERRGIGRVDRGLWEAAQNETNDIVLA